MKIRIYNDLNTKEIPGFSKFIHAIERNDFTYADVRKIDSNLYRARLNIRDRILFSLYRYEEEIFCLILEFLPNHSYNKSRFIGSGLIIDESKLQPLTGTNEITPPELTYINSTHERFCLLDKIISFDDEQLSTYENPLPLIIVGSAGSGKTAIMLEKMKQAIGDVMYISLSSFLVQSARNLYYSNGYHNNDQQVDFLSFREFLESLQIPEGKEITFTEFEAWFQRNRISTPFKDPHMLFEEFRGVITASVSDSEALSLNDYLALGIKQSIFSASERPLVYSLFERYVAWLQKNCRFDPNILSHHYQALATPNYDFILVDEIQDITNIQLFLILKTLRKPGNFLLCGDANQIVHPNFFSWAKMKSMFFDKRDLFQGECIRILHANYRNAPQVTALANQLLKLKHARFGSIDKESHYLINSICSHNGTLQLLQDTNSIKQALNEKTALSTHFAILVMHPEQKLQAKKWFKTPLIFSIQEAKGLEYENVILLNFISDEEKAFREICMGVTPEVIENTSLKNYSRAKDKNDRSLEIYKFFINALYVAVTRAYKNIYMVEKQHQHPMLELLNMSRFSGDLSVDAQASSLDEWQKEAYQLELQGKQEQADAIRELVLQQKMVPWTVLDRESFRHMHDLLKKNMADKHTRLLALEYALIYNSFPVLNLLWLQGFKPAMKNKNKSRRQLEQKYFRAYEMKNSVAVMRDVELYGADYRTVFNLTPLMIATRMGNIELVQALLARGANPWLAGSDGLCAYHWVLSQAVKDSKYACKKSAMFYEKLKPENVSIQVDDRLVKIDGHHMGVFLLNLMSALFYSCLGNEFIRFNAFTSRQLADYVMHFSTELLPERRKRQSYISSILSQNEASAQHKYNKKLFIRLRRGQYVLNPRLKIRFWDGDWIRIYEQLSIDDLGYDVHEIFHDSTSPGKKEIINYADSIIESFVSNLK